MYRGPASVGGGAGAAHLRLALCLCMLRGFALHLLTCYSLNSSVPGQRGHQRESAAAQRPPLLAGAPATQRCHHRI